jgi:hypothetical protein
MRPLSAYPIHDKMPFPSCLTWHSGHFLRHTLAIVVTTNPYHDDFIAFVDDVIFIICRYFGPLQHLDGDKVVHITLATELVYNYSAKV